jgi:hypothetical protein
VRRPPALAAEVDGPKVWTDETGYGAGEVGKPAFVVVTSSPPESVRLTDLDWRFVTTGLFRRRHRCACARGGGVGGQR